MVRRVISPFMSSRLGAGLGRWPRLHGLAVPTTPCWDPRTSAGRRSASGTNYTTGLSSVYVFTQPAGGWSGTVNEVARLIDSQGLSLSKAVISGRSIFADAAKPGFCCGASTKVDVFNEPSGGWSGVVRQSATLPAAGRLSVSGQAVLASGMIFREPPGGWHGVIQPVGALIPEDQQM